MNKKKIFALCISFALICVLVFFVYPTKASADEHMNLTRSERVSLAKAEYSEFLEKPSKKSEVLVTFNNATADEIINIMKNDVEVISAFHTFTAYGETAVGGYRECEGKTVKEVIVDYYNSIYNMLGATISNYEDNREAADNADSESEAETNPWTEKMSEEY